MSAIEAKIERRSFEIEDLKMEKRGEAATMPTISGHAARFNLPSQPMGGFVRFIEQIAPGAFKDSIVVDDIRALINHDPMYVIGRNKAGTLTLREDAKGLAVDITPPDTSYARDLVESIKRGDISQMSFGFDVIDDTWDFKREGENPALRTLNKVKLYDVSPVTYPAYTQTDVNVRSLDSVLAEGMERAGIGAIVRGGRPIAILRRRLDLEL